MPIRSPHRDQAWLLPPTLDDLLPDDDTARFVWEFIEALPAAWWHAAGIDPAGSARGAPAYAPKVLLALWLYGFMDGKRSTRALERACRRDIAYIWLSGNQRPDHNTLHRFYQAHRAAMRELFAMTVRVAVRSGLVQWALQAVDGTKLEANAAVEASLTEAQLAGLLERVEDRIAELESQVAGEAAEATLPAALRSAQARRERIAAALADLVARPQLAKRNLTDPEARIMRTRRGQRPCYNGQATVTPVAPGDGGGHAPLVTAAALRDEPVDYACLVEQIAAAAQLTGQVAAVTTADAGYFSHEAIATCAERGYGVVVPEPAAPAQRKPAAADRFGLDDFSYDEASDTFTCPAGQVLTFRRESVRASGGPARRHYRPPAGRCRGCPLARHCLSPQGTSREVRVAPGYGAVLRHRAWMATEAAAALGRRRRSLIEPFFGTLKEVLGVRRLLRRGRANAESEYLLALAASNLRTLVRCWRGGRLVLT